MTAARLAVRVGTGKDLDNPYRPSSGALLYSGAQIPTKARVSELGSLTEVVMGCQRSASFRYCPAGTDTGKPVTFVLRAITHDGGNLRFDSAALAAGVTRPSDCVCLAPDLECH
jgi:hypothetical protein